MAIINHDICRECKGMCCQELGCALAPRDFGEITRESINERLKKDILFTLLPSMSITQYPVRIMGKICFAIFVPRIKGIYDENTYLLTNSKKGNPCMYWLSENGCKFSDERRPFGGLSVIPSEDRCCVNTYEGTQKQEEDWMPHQDMIISVLRNLGAL